MAKRIKLRASVGRQNVTDVTPLNESRYVASIRAQLKVITDNFERVAQEMGGASAEVLYDALLPTFRLSQKYVPKDTGRLRDSGFIEKDERSKFPRVVIGYGKNGDPNYAIFVHEMVHISHAPPTRSKYLLSALEEDAASIQRRIVRGYKQMLGASV